MNVVTVASPWYPLAYARLLAPDGPPRVVNIPFEQWLIWRRNCIVPDQSAENMLAVVRAAIA